MNSSTSCLRTDLNLPRSGLVSGIRVHSIPCCTLTYYSKPPPPPVVCVLATTATSRRGTHQFPYASAGTTNSSREGTYTVGDFMTGKEHLHVVKPTTTVDEALETLVEKRITGFPVIDDDWKLVGVVSDYDLLALDSISGGGQQDASMFPDVDSTWKIFQPDNLREKYRLVLYSLSGYRIGHITFNEIQKLLSKTNGQVVSDVMTAAPLVVRENTNLEDAVRLLLKTKYRRLPVVDSEGKLVGIITRGNVVRAALQMKQDNEKM